MFKLLQMEDRKSDVVLTSPAPGDTRIHLPITDFNFSLYDSHCDNMLARLRGAARAASSDKIFLRLMSEAFRGSTGSKWTL